MVSGSHVVIYAAEADKARAFFKDVLGLGSVDAGGGWLIFALPPAEVACHPAEPDKAGTHELYLTTTDLASTVAELKGKGVEFTMEPTDLPWGILSRLKIPGGGEIGLYQPKHALPPR